MGTQHALLRSGLTLRLYNNLCLILKIACLKYNPNLTLFETAFIWLQISLHVLWIFKSQGLVWLVLVILSDTSKVFNFIFQNYNIPVISWRKNHTHARAHTHTHTRIHTLHTRAHVEKSTLDLAGQGLDFCMGISSLKFDNFVNPHFWHSGIDFGALMYKNSV